MSELAAIDEPPRRPWTLAALLCGSAALVLCLVGYAVFAFASFTHFPASLWVDASTPPLDPAASSLAYAALYAATLLAGFGIVDGIVALVRREAVASPLVALGLALCAFLPAANITLPAITRALSA